MPTDMLIIPHLKKYLPKLGNNSKKVGANKLVLLYVQDYVTVVHLTEVRFWLWLEGHGL
jgi:hypothetical protein